MRTVIIAPPPTPNGDLHVGHMAGPYLCCDIYARYLRADGRAAIYATGTDDSQTFVLASARRKGTTPEALAAQCWHDIGATLEAAGISVDGFAPFDERYRATVLEFVDRLHAAGKFRLRTVRMPYSERSGEFLMEGLVAGDCPICLTFSRGGLCETCGRPNTFDELLNPRSTVDPSDPLTTREATVLVLPMEEYRTRLTAFYAEAAPRWRPHLAQLVREVLAGPLPDFPITYPHHWGIPAPFPETPGQVINAWVEGMPASMYCTAYAAERLGAPAGPVDALWRSEQATKLVYCLGFDNAYFWGLTHLALLMAHDGRYIVPDTIVCNEFYELEHEKFSTSKGHVVWVRDLLRDVPRDFARFYLALTCPENQRTNFSRSGPLTVAQRLVEPWNRIAAMLEEAVARAGLRERTLTVPQAARERVALMVERFRACYELRDFSASRAADVIVGQLERLERSAQWLSPVCAAAADEIAGLYHELLALVACASPILIDLADAVRERSGVPLSIAALPEARAVPAFALPLLSPVRSLSGQVSFT